MSLPTVDQVYSQYHLMPSLQLHMRRVAAVAKTIAEAFDQPLEVENITSACLLHDLGNIIKSDFSVFPEFVQPEGREYWERVKAEVMAKYGTNVHAATVVMAREVGVSSRTLEMIDAMGFELIEAVQSGNDWALQICDYADCRVMPQGVSSLAERWQDLETRYTSRFPSEQDRAKRQHYGELLKISEQKIFSHCGSLGPADLTEASLSDTIKSLEKYQLV